MHRGNVIAVAPPGLREPYVGGEFLAKPFRTRGWDGADQPAGGVGEEHAVHTRMGVKGVGQPCLHVGIAWPAQDHLLDDGGVLVVLEHLPGAAGFGIDQARQREHEGLAVADDAALDGAAQDREGDHGHQNGRHAPCQEEREGDIQGPEWTFSEKSWHCGLFN